MEHTINICGDDVVTITIPQSECDSCDELVTRLDEIEEAVVDVSNTASEALELAQSLEGLNAYDKVEVNGTILPAVTHDATLGLVAGQNVVLTPNQIDGTVTISATESGETLENVKDATGTRGVVGNDVNVNTATGDYASAFGTNTTASGANQFVVGKYNADDTNNDYAFIVGNGSESARTNGFAVDWSGIPYFRGLPGTNSTLSSSGSVPNSTDFYLDNVYTADHWGIFIGFVRVQFAASATGRRLVTVVINHTDATTVETNSRWLGAPSPTQQTVVTLPIIENIHVGEGIGVKVFQNSGGALAASAYVHGFILRAT